MKYLLHQAAKKVSFKAKRLRNQICSFQVDVKKDFVKVSTKDGTVLLEGNLFDQVKCNETIWNLVPGKKWPPVFLRIALTLHEPIVC